MGSMYHSFIIVIIFNKYFLEMTTYLTYCPQQLLEQLPECRRDGSVKE